MGTLLEYIKHFTNNLGIQRKDMPQITKDNLEGYKAFLKSKGIQVSDKKMKPWRVKPTQTYIDTDKVDSQVKNIKDGGKTKIIVSSDNYILDGHHSWGAYMEIDPNGDMPVIFINSPIKEILKISKDFHGVEFRAS